MTLFLLPPSETKRDGGTPGSRLSFSTLSFPSLSAPRTIAVESLAAISVDDDASARALRVSARAATRERERNRHVWESPTLPALERYTGVLYDALGLEDWDAAARQRADDHIAIQSALFGLLGAGDLIPAYRLSHDSRLPGQRMASLWSAPVSELLARHSGPLLDLRSEAYAALGPIPQRDDAVFVRVVEVGDDGMARALSHANKAGKGRFLRAIFTAGPVPESLDDLRAASARLGWQLRPGAPGELELVLPAR